jgi:hypothetical protein
MMSSRALADSFRGDFAAQQTLAFGLRPYPGSTADGSPDDHLTAKSPAPADQIRRRDNFQRRPPDSLTGYLP